MIVEGRAGRRRKEGRGSVKGKLGKKRKRGDRRGILSPICRSHHLFPEAKKDQSIYKSAFRGS